MTATIEDAKKLPQSPGVYIMKDRENKVIYVGKAASLRDRVSQYFREQGLAEDADVRRVYRLNGMPGMK